MRNGEYKTKPKRRNERLEKMERIERHNDKIGMLRAIMLEHENLARKCDGSPAGILKAQEHVDEARKCGTRVRVLEQQVRYIGEGLGDYEL